MTDSIKGPDVNKAFARELPQVKENFASMHRAVTSAFESADFKSLVTEASIIDRSNVNAYQTLKADTIDTKAIKNLRGIAGPEQTANETLDDKLKSAPEIAVAPLTSDSKKGLENSTTEITSRSQ